MKRKLSRLLLILPLAGALSGGGCAAYDGLIGHPLHVLIEQHREHETYSELPPQNAAAQQEAARKLGELMYEDTHPK